MNISLEKIKRAMAYEMENRLENNEKAQDIIIDLIERYNNRITVRDSFQLTKWLKEKYIYKLGVLNSYIKKNNINEIMVNGVDNIFIESKGKITRANTYFDSKEDLEEIIRYIASTVHREINEMNPILDARLEDGSRVNAVLSNIALDGPVLTIRKFSHKHISMDDMVESGSLNPACNNAFRILVGCGYNIFVSGGTSSGKTTFLNALADYIPKRERVIIIEDSRELQMQKVENLVQMECHNANSTGKGLVTMADLIRSSLRMRPDRLIIGEVRGGEVADMLQAMNTGHYSMSTGHGNSIKGMLRRLEAMYLMSVTIPMDAIRAQITEGIDIMVHLMRDNFGRRKVMEVSELVGFKEGEYVLNSLFIRNENDKLIRTENKLINRSRLVMGDLEDEYCEI